MLVDAKSLIAKVPVPSFVFFCLVIPSLGASVKQAIVSTLRIPVDGPKGSTRRAFAEVAPPATEK